MISYAGEPLVHGDAELLARVQEGFDVWWPSHGAARSRPRLPGSDPALGGAGPWPPCPARVNSLYWPTGASRWACGWILCDEDALEAARLAELQDGGAEFVFDDGVAAVTATLSMLPATPLERVAVVTPGLYLLPLVDDRYFWWEEQSPIAVVAGTTTWAQLYALIGTALGVTITADTVSSAYLSPSASLGLPRGPLPPLLDLTAAACGQRIVRRPDGTVLALTAANSLLLHDAHIAALAGSRLAGHKIDLGA